MLHDLTDTEIADAFQSAAGFLHLESLAGAQGKSIGQYMIAGSQTLHQGGHRYNQYSPLHACQSRQGSQPFRNDFRQGRKNVVGQGFPIRKAQYGYFLIQKKADFMLQSQGRGAVFGDNQTKGFNLLGQFGNRQRVTASLPDRPNRQFSRFDLKA